VAEISLHLCLQPFIFPKKEAGTALGIQAGVGNFGVSLVQLLSPMIIGLSLFSFLGGGQIIVETGKNISAKHRIHLHYPTFNYQDLGLVFTEKHSCKSIFQRAIRHFQRPSYVVLYDDLHYDFRDFCRFFCRISINDKKPLHAFR
jgi:nitrate/nitrite transporter NarK